jgi:hypothetical protein
VTAKTGGLSDNHDVLSIAAFGEKSEESKQFDHEAHEQQLKVESDENKLQKKKCLTFFLFLPFNNRSIVGRSAEKSAAAKSTTKRLGRAARASATRRKKSRLTKSWKKDCPNITLARRSRFISVPSLKICREFTKQTIQTTLPSRLT